MLRAAGWWWRGGLIRRTLHEVASPRGEVVAKAVAAVARPTASWVSDSASVLRRKGDVDEILEQLSDDTGCQVAVATTSFDPVDGDEAKVFATSLLDSWGVGDAKYNNGLVVVVFAAARRIELRTGRGMRAVCDDDFLVDVARETMAPYFKSGHFDEGLAAGFRRIGDRVRSRAPWSWLSIHLRRWAFGDAAPADEPPYGLLVAAVGVAVVAAWLLLGESYDRADRSCDVCKARGLAVTMTPRSRVVHANVFDVDLRDQAAGFDAVAALDGDVLPPVTELDGPCRVDERRGVVVDDAGRVVVASPRLARLPPDCVVDSHTGDIYERDPIAAKLSPCFLLERELTSARFDDVVCPECGAAKIVRDVRRASGFATCNQCHCRAAVDDTVVRLAPTSTSPGLQEVTRTCKFCSHVETEAVAIPRVPHVSTTTSSSSSSSQSFGGGSSRGGGGGGASF